MIGFGEMVTATASDGSTPRTPCMAVTSLRVVTIAGSPDPLTPDLFASRHQAPVTTSGSGQQLHGTGAEDPADSGQ